MRQFEKKLEIVFIAFVLVLGLYYMWLASGTPILGEDEGLYYSMAKFFANGEYPPMMGSNMNFIVPFGPLIYSSIFIFTGSSLVVAKIITALFALLTLLLLYIIGKKYNLYFGIFAALITLSIGTFSHLSMIAYFDIPIAFFSLLIVYIMLHLSKLNQAILLGSVFSLACYTKGNIMILLGVLLFYALFKTLSKKDTSYLKFAIISLVFFAIFLIPFATRNLILFNFPNIEGINYFFKQPWWPAWLNVEIAKNISLGQVSLAFYTATFGWLSIILTIFGFAFLAINCYDTELKDTLLVSVLSIIIMFLAFNITLLTGSKGLEPRYFSVIFPQLAIISGFFLYKAKEWNKFIPLFILPIIIFSLWSGITTAQLTHNTQRYPSDYIEAMTWLKNNTPSESLIFTTYGGSLMYYADRNWVWATSPCMSQPFPEVMTTRNGTYIYNTLKNCNVSHILIWSATVAQNYIIPESNIWGAFTYNFIDVVTKDTEHFKTVYQNQNNLILSIIN